MVNLKKKSAFSFIEISVVIVIISIIIAAIASSQFIIQKARITNAQKQTANSVVNQMEDVYLWLETTKETSFEDGKIEENIAVNKWLDINPNPQKRRNASAFLSINAPIYKNDCINRLPCLRFDGANDYLNFDASKLTNTDYTIFIVEQRQVGGANPMIGKISNPIPNNSIEVGYLENSVLFLSQGLDINSYYKFSNQNLANFSANSPNLHIFVNQSLKSGLSDVRHYLNGSSSFLFSVPLNIGEVSSFESATIAADNNGLQINYFNGDIGEIIIFNKALNSKERNLVEYYLLKKWKIQKASNNNSIIIPTTPPTTTPTTPTTPTEPVLPPTTTPPLVISYKIYEKFNQT